MSWWHYLHVITALNKCIGKQHWDAGYKLADELDNFMSTAPASVVTYVVFGKSRKENIADPKLKETL